MALNSAPVHHSSTPRAAMTRLRPILTTLALGASASVFAAAPLAGQAGGALSPDSATLAGLRWRSVGPVNMAGRITNVEAHPGNPTTFYVAGATGGLWKTVNAGTTFVPLWEQAPISSLGDVAIAPSNPRIVWLGTGEEDSRNSVQPGYGVYKSTDGGVTWQSMGLEKTQHIGRILVHPTNPDVVWVAALGALWTTNPERGLYKTTDGGKSWTLSKFISDKAGFVDLAMDPRNPDVLYAASWERIRKGHYLKAAARAARSGRAPMVAPPGARSPATDCRAVSTAASASRCTARTRGWWW